MDIGTEEQTTIVEPLEDPVPAHETAPAEPMEVPEPERETVPANLLIEHRQLLSKLQRRGAYSAQAEPWTVSLLGRRRRSPVFPSRTREGAAAGK